MAGRGGTLSERTVARGVSRRRASLVAAAAAALFSAAPVPACGPFFPQQLLRDRHASVYDLVDGSFDFEASQLGARVAGLKPNESPWEAPGESRIALEKQQLGEAGFAQVEQMRLAADDAQARRAGAGLGEEVFLYTLGARAFHAGDYRGARQHFAAVLALAPEQRGQRGLWARYMLGRIGVADAAGGAGITEAETAAQVQAAARDLQEVRAAVLAGAADPLGLAVASYGEEAALQLRTGDKAAAVRLYAEQAAQDSASGRASLLFLARSLLADETSLQQALADPLLQRLLAAYVYTRTGEIGSGAAAPLVERYYAAVEAAASDTLAGVDRVAAAAYRAGRFDLAGKLAARSDAALAHWVRAKVALRSGDEAAAAAAYAAASRAFPRDEDWGLNVAEGYAYDNLKPACRVDGERAILALGRGDYVEALRLLHAADGYWMDEAQIAERVLSLDELKQFVDQHVAEPPSAPPPTDEYATPPPNRDRQLRALLGRRLLRGGRYADAAAYFPADLRETAAAYAQARLDAPRLGRIERAEALFRAAQLARESGMDILALELAPDAAVFGGDYEVEELRPGGEFRQLEGRDEAQRVDASAAQPALRFHYRYLAANLAGQAADLVPARSQAFAAMLCSATGWLIHRDYASGRRYYERYVADGAYLPWAAHFGNACPAPDFAAAAQRAQLERQRYVKRLLRQSAPYAAVVMLALGTGLLFWRHRRRRPTATPAR